LGQRPGGLRLDGVAALGIGMRDGDILTHVLGAPATSVAVVVGAVIQARAQNVRTITGQFWRDGRALPIAVEQPYLAATESVQVSATP
jgi:S1-C subfamily serine protease